jgi:DNA polymerase I-like protein with 3'-5' exonuclease and polymerase domains
VSDYGQIELVLLAHFIGHGAMWDGFLNGIDPHVLTAAMALNEDPAILQSLVDSGDKEAKRKRQVYGKSINFATVYGAGLKKLASMLSCSVSEAKRFKATYDRNTPEIGAYRAEVLREARRHSMRRTGMPPHVTTLLGGVRRLPGLLSSDDGLRAYSERQAFNSKIQGSSADLTKLAMVRYYETRDPDWDLLLTVHDELVIQAPLAQVDAAKACLIEAMTGEGIQNLVNLQLKVDVHVVNRWSHAK